MIQNSTPVGRPTPADADSSRRNKYVLIGIWACFAVLWIVPSIFVNLYTFGGIDFPNEAASTVWGFGGPILLYGSALLAPLVAVLGVRTRNIAIPLLVAVLAVPIVMQVLALVLYSVFAERYGVICC